MRGRARTLALVTGVFALIAVPRGARAAQEPEAQPEPTPPNVPAPAPPAVTAPAPSSAPAAAAPSVAATAPRGGVEAATELGSAAASSGHHQAEPSWFDRAPLTVSVGQGSQAWSVTFFGFVQADYIFDTTRSYDDTMGGALVARTDRYDGRASRSQFSVRNSRLGMIFTSPVIAGIAPMAVLEGDFMGDQQNPAPAAGESALSVSENAFYASPKFRIRHAYLKLPNEYVDVLAGQTYDVFGWQNSYSPCSVQYLGLPNQLFSRNAQLRLSRTFGASSPVSLDVAASAVRPVQRNSGIPDAHAGLRFNVNGWKGITTPGNLRTVALPLSLGVSATVRQFRVHSFTPPPVQNSNSASGWGLSVDALIPIIPASHANDRGNKLTIVGSFVIGTGIADLITAGGGAAFTPLPNPTQANPPPAYHGDIDNGLVTFDQRGVLHTIDWRAFKVGVQYYLPPSGRVTVSANLTQGYSSNMSKLFFKGGAEIELLTRVADTSYYADVNVFWDATPAVRFGLGGHYATVTYLDGNKPHNIRGMGQAMYAF